jgi:hypothetical protein
MSDREPDATVTRSASPSSTEDVGAGRTDERAATTDGPGTAPTDPRRGFLPPGPPRLAAESVLVRLIASAGIAGIGTALGAVLVAYDIAGWIVGLVVSVVSMVLAAMLWRSRRL